MSQANRPLVVGNWKMNGSRAALSELSAMGKGFDGALRSKLDLVICPPMTLVALVSPAGAIAFDAASFGLSAICLALMRTTGAPTPWRNRDFRSEPPNPRDPVSIFNLSTIPPDTMRPKFEIENSYEK